MVYYLIVCRSLTYAQRTAKVLERAGITSYIIRVPKNIAKEGCGHGVKVAQKNLEASLTALKRSELSPKQLFITFGDNHYREVSL
ncbi:MAG: DUF3343 domain-containing protein [Eubacteriales bacterium]